jgi:polysaccharide deacetylase 2 family uncharacterized protein YibQ
MRKTLEQSLKDSTQMARKQKACSASVVIGEYILNHRAVAEMEILPSYVSLAFFSFCHIDD